jgi:hypothetical protein
VDKPLLRRSLLLSIIDIRLFIYYFSLQKPPPPSGPSGFADYQDIEIITAPPPDSRKGFGQSFEVKVS